jgi:hypothetical protein
MESFNKKIWESNEIIIADELKKVDMKNMIEISNRVYSRRYGNPGWSIVCYLLYVTPN